MHYFYHGTVNQDALPQLSFRDPLWSVWDYNLLFLLCNKQLVNTSAQSPLKQMLAVGGLGKCSRQLCLGRESIYVHNVRPSEIMWLMLAIGSSVICAIQRWGTLSQRWGTWAIVIKENQPLKCACNESLCEAAIWIRFRFGKVPPFQAQIKQQSSTRQSYVCLYGFYKKIYNVFKTHL